MSHSPERTEANCLNCNTEVIGRYCHVCGQENIEPRESFWSLLTHFFNDITHFDGKFFKTLGALVSKPGYLPLQYMKGRRARYLHPIRMYLFTSAVFFLVFYSYTSDSGVKVESESTAPTFPFERNVVPDTADMTVIGTDFETVAAYDSAQRLLPASQRDNWLKRMVVSRGISMKSRYKGNKEEFFKDFSYGLVHSLPSLLFISLPLFALVLKLLYARRNFMYGDHAIYLIYLYIFMFIFMMVFIGVDKVSGWLNAGWMNFLLVLLVLGGIVYSLVGMKNFYRQGWMKTTLKFIIFNSVANIIVLILFIIFVLLTLFRV